MQRLLSGSSIDEAAKALAGTEVLPDPQRLGGWLHGWLAQGMLRQFDYHQATPALTALAPFDAIVKAEKDSDHASNMVEYAI